MPRSEASNTFMKKYSLLLILVVFIFGIITISDYIRNVFRQPKSKTNEQTILSTNKSALNTVEIKINDIKIIAEIANTDQSRQNGLSFREKLDENSGMLFVFNTPLKPFFWMKDMKFPLDMIWIMDNKIVDINNNVPIPKPDTPLNQLPKYSPKEKVNYVLEVNGGFADKNNIKVGDNVIINF